MKQGEQLVVKYFIDDVFKQKFDGMLNSQLNLGFKIAQPIKVIANYAYVIYEKL